MKNNKPQKEETVKLNFFKMLWYSIIKYEKYPEMAALGIKKALIYFSEIMLLFSIIFSIAYSYSVYTNRNESFLIDEMVKQVIDENNNIEEDKKEEIENGIKQTFEKNAIVILFVVTFISIYITTLLDVLTLSVFGILICLITKLKIKYKAIFNMSIYAMTLSILLRMVYFIITLFTNFKIKYFEVVYNSIAFIILTAAIFMIKSDVIKQQLQLIGFIEESKEKLENKIVNPKKQKEEDEEEEKEEEDSEEKEEKRKSDNNSNEQGSNA